MAGQKQDLLRKLPSVDAVLKNLGTAGSDGKLPRKVAAGIVREAIEEKRRLILEQGRLQADKKTNTQQIVEDVRARMERVTRPHYRRAINATGIILHTGLGRAVLAQKAIERIGSELSGYSLLQMDIETGKRSRRDWRSPSAWA